MMFELFPPTSSMLFGTFPNLGYTYAPKEARKKMTIHGYVPTDRDPETYLPIERNFETKDSGAREEYTSGMVRDTQKGKPRYDLCDKTMYTRWADLMARGAEKYGDHNWRKAEGKEELDRFKSSAERHMMYWLMGREDEDHAAAVFFNIAAAEYLKSKMKGDK